MHTLMVNVVCDGCQSEYKLDERRIPAAGMKMRCPKCGKSLDVAAPGGSATGFGTPPASISAEKISIASKPTMDLKAPVSSTDASLDLDEPTHMFTPQSTPAAAPKASPLHAPLPPPDSVAPKTPPTQSWMHDDPSMAFRAQPKAAPAAPPVPSPAPPPVTARSDFGKLDLDLPARREPVAAAKAPSVPVSKAARDLDLPSALGGLPAALGGNLPSPASNSPSTPRSNSAPAVLGGLDDDFGDDLLSALSGKIAPTPSPVGLRLGDVAPEGTTKLDVGLDDIPAVFGGPLPESKRGGAPSGPSSVKFDLDSPPPSVKPASRSFEAETVGAEAELPQATQSTNEAIAVAETEKKKSRVPAPAKKRSRHTALLSAGAFLVAVAGGSLALSPELGAFGALAILDWVHKDDQARQYSSFQTTLQQSVALDTSAAGQTALAAIKAHRAALPRHKPSAALAAAALLYADLRFGRSGDQFAFASELLEYVRAHAPELSTLPNAVGEAAAGKYTEAEAALQGLSQGPEGWLAALAAGEANLAAMRSEQAIALFKAASEKLPSAAASFGLARAYVQENRWADAREALQQTLKASPDHIGARLFLADLALSNEPPKEPDRIALEAVAKEDSPASARERADARTLLGKAELVKARLSLADKAFASALSLDPSHHDALVGAGEVLFQSARLTEALTRFESAAKARPASVPAALGVAKTLLAQGEEKRAKDQLRTLAAAHPKNAWIHYWQGKAAEATGDRKGAEALFASAIANEAAPPSARVSAYVALANAYSSTGKTDEAAAKLSEATGAFPESVSLLRAKADLFMNTNRWELAKTELEAALAKEPDVSTLFKLGVVHRKLRAFDTALATYEKVAAQDKDFPGLTLERGLYFEDTGKSEEALRMYADALAKAPNDLDLKLRVGSSQVLASNAEQAEPLLRDVVKERPNHAEGFHYLGRALLLKGRLPESRPYLERAVELNPNRAEYHLWLAVVANESGALLDAERSLERAQSLDRDMAEIYWQRGVLLQKQGATIDAIVELQRALEKQPTLTRAYASLAACYQDQSRWTEAAEAWRKAIQDNPRQAEWHYRLGKILITRGGGAEARESLSKSVTLAEAAKSVPVWIFDAYFNLAEAERAAGAKTEAIEHYKRFLALAPIDNAYRAEAIAALKAAGERASGL